MLDASFCDPHRSSPHLLISLPDLTVMSLYLSTESYLAIYFFRVMDTVYHREEQNDHYMSLDSDPGY